MNIDNKNIHGETALMMAVKSIQNEHISNDDGSVYNIINSFIHHYPNMNINAQDNNGYTALMHCIKLTTKRNISISIRIVKMLLEHNADANVLGNDGRTALSIALNNQIGSFEIVQILAEKYTRINIDNTTAIDNGIMLFNLGNFYEKHNKIKEMKKYYFMGAMMNNMNSKVALYYHYKNISHALITKEEHDFIVKMFKRESAFVMLYKSKFFHEIGECQICLEDTDNIVTLPCHKTHKICIVCIDMLKKGICPFCRIPFFPHYACTHSPRNDE